MPYGKAGWERDEKHILRGQLVSEIQPNFILALVAVVGIGIYILSWYLSIVFFKKREIQ